VSHALDDLLADRIRSKLAALLAQHHGGLTICPTDAARLIAHELNTEWRELMRPVRCVAQQMAASGSIEVLQRNRPVDIRDVRGPVRLRLKRAV
jgi:hypothetical protein